ncbi:MAG: hypothetical protein JJE40_10080 [Vicinamibacteria bacterium]|nr:hypothetical protein [Vicinamibacteria bacterium]
MVSLADLRARNVTPIWQEAVAVVQELIQTVKTTSGSAELLPDLEHVALIPNGDVVAIPGSPEPAIPVRHVAVMLKLLIDGTPVPPELEQFVGRNVAEPPQYDTVAEFSRNLAFFERPGRRSDVERLVGRALTAEQTSRADEELKRLKERASEVTQVMAPPEFLQQQKTAKTVPIALVAAIGVVTIAVGLWVWQQARAPQAPPAAAAVVVPEPQAVTPEGQAAPVPASPTPPPPAPQGERSLLGRASDAVRTAVNSLVGSPAPPAPAMATTAKPSTEAKMAAAPRPRSRRAATPAAVVAAGIPAPAPVAVAPPTPVVVPPTPEPGPAPASLEPVVEDPIAVFTAADPTVTPAVLVRPVLPKELPPGVPADQIGTIEVVVDEQGDVLHVKLISPGNRYHERMLVSAAKMWKFRPAYKDGRPVRYMARVRLTI